MSLQQILKITVLIVELSQCIHKYLCTITVINRLSRHVFQVVFKKKSLNFHSTSTFTPRVTVTIILSEVCQPVVTHYVTCCCTLQFKMSRTKSSHNQDLLQAELQTAQVCEIRDAVTWHVTDIINSASYIQLSYAHAQATYRNKVKLQRAVTDLRDVSSKLQEIKQYLSQ